MNPDSRSPEEQASLNEWLGVEARMLHVEGCQKALEAGTQPDATFIDSSGRWRCALHLAALGGHAELCRLLLSHSASPDVRTEFHETPLIFASGEGHLQVCLVLLQAGVDVDARDRSEDTALHWAAAKNEAGTAAILVQHGASFLLRNTNGFTPEQLAHEVGHLETQSALVSLEQAGIARQAMDAIFTRCGLDSFRGFVSQRTRPSWSLLPAPASWSGASPCAPSRPWPGTLPMPTR